jgi:transcriptional regulator of arginine metabolism
MQKTERHKSILDLISQNPVRRQDELAELLRRNGFEVTQASVSRDLDELGVVKVGGRYVQAAVAETQSNPFGITSIEACGDNLLVLKCAAGLASAAAVKIDADGIEEISGTIAGDDTVFVAIRNASRQKIAIKKLRALFSR